MKTLACCHAAALLLLPLAAVAQQSITTQWVNLRAGPAPDYPLVARVAPQTPLSVQGCTEGYSWCDVVLPNGERGWVYGAYMATPYQGAEVPVLNYGATIGIPIVAFALGAYWSDHYRGRPWYAERPRWEHHHYRPPPRHVPRPPMVRPHGPSPSFGRHDDGWHGERHGGSRDGGRDHDHDHDRGGDRDRDESRGDRGDRDQSRPDRRPEVRLPAAPSGTPRGGVFQRGGSQGDGHRGGGSGHGGSRGGHSNDGGRGR